MPACAAPISAPDDRCRPLAESARAGSSTNPIPAASDTAANKSSGTPRAAIEPRTRACRPGGMRGRASGWSFLARLCRAHSLSSAAGSRPRGRCGYCNRGKGIARPEQPREQERSWRARTRTPGLGGDRARAPSSVDRQPEQARARSCVGTDRTDDRRDPDHRAVASPRGAVISSAPARALLRFDQPSYLAGPLIAVGFVPIAATRRAVPALRSLPLSDRSSRAACRPSALVWA